MLIYTLQEDNTDRGNDGPNGTYGLSPGIS